MKTTYLCTSLLFWLLTTTVHAQQAIYMKATDVNGEVVVTGYENWFQLSSVQFGESATPPSSTGSGSGSGTLSFTPITITKVIDGLSSAQLTLFLVRGRHIATAEIHFVNTVENKTKTFYKIELKDVVMINHSVSVVPNCPNGCSGLTESFQLTYVNIQVTTYWQLSTGEVVTANIHAYNRQTGSTTF